MTKMSLEDLFSGAVEYMTRIARICPSVNGQKIGKKFDMVFFIFVAFCDIDKQRVKGAKTSVAQMNLKYVKRFPSYVFENSKAKTVSFRL